jgi:GMP synthase (glutamine-hydrolysing)
LQPQITVLDAGGQYCHLIARKVRDLGVYAEVCPSDTPASELIGRKGIIISGGPSSVYEPGSPQIDPAVFGQGSAVLGICYGQQLMAHLLGGKVRKGVKGEYGFARFEITAPGVLFRNIGGEQQVWMNHRDAVGQAPPGFEVLGYTPACEIASMADPARKLYAVQFHPEVAHTPRGKDILSNFLFGVCGCERDWSATGQIDALQDQIRTAAAGRNVFFFVSGGVDSTVAYTLCLRALGPERVYGTYVDSGLMRDGETEFVRSLFARLGATHFRAENASAEFLAALAGVCDPERKRHIIGEQFVKVQERILQEGHFLDGHWILGQGTIYPDTIESGGTARADVIKTHHNRVAGIQRLIESGRIIEPLTQFYKDEVRRIGREAGLPEEMLERHPFPGPGLAIRCLCSEARKAVRRSQDGWILPVASVGVQGDSRSYRSVIALDEFPEQATELAAELVNREADINRVVVKVASHAPLDDLRSTPSTLSAERLARLRLADAIVRRATRESGFDSRIWQMPVVLIPVGADDRPDSVVLRPIDSVDGMTAEAVIMPDELLENISRELLELEGICALFYDITNKPPGTIEWE